MYTVSLSRVPCLWHPQRPRQFIPLPPWINFAFFLVGETPFHFRPLVPPSAPASPLGPSAGPSLAESGSVGERSCS